MSKQTDILKGTPIKEWDDEMIALAEALLKDMKETRALYRQAREERERYE